MALTRRHDVRPDSPSVDFRYIDDAITEQEALALLNAQRKSREARIADLERSGYPAYTTSVGWFGFSDEKVRSLCHEALAQGWRHFKLKVGVESAAIFRLAPHWCATKWQLQQTMMDAMNDWGVTSHRLYPRACRVSSLVDGGAAQPGRNLLGHARIRRESGVRIATGEHCQNRVMFKQLLQAGAIDFCQIDSCRLAGVNENLAVLLMAAKFGVPVCPHAGGVGLCEYVQHLSAFDYIAVSGSLENRVTEYVDHLHEHFVDPVRIRNAHYLLPTQPGYSAEMYPQTLKDYSFPDGKVWEDLSRETDHLSSHTGRSPGAGPAPEGCSLSSRTTRVCRCGKLHRRRRKSARFSARRSRQTALRASLSVQLLSPLLHPPRIFCVGLNYLDHAAESKMAVQAVPTIFMKLPSAITGPDSDIVLPPNSTQPDYEAELAVGDRSERSQRDPRQLGVSAYWATPF